MAGCAAVPGVDVAGGGIVGRGSVAVGEEVAVIVAVGGTAVVGTGVAVSVGLGVAVGVRVGLVGVAVGGSGVSVDGGGVSVGGADVAVAVAGAGVAVSATLEGVEVAGIFGRYMACPTLISVEVRQLTETTLSSVVPEFLARLYNVSPRLT